MTGGANASSGTRTKTGSAIVERVVVTRVTRPSPTNLVISTAKSNHELYVPVMNGHQLLSALSNEPSLLRPRLPAERCLAVSRHPAIASAIISFTPEARSLPSTTSPIINRTFIPTLCTHAPQARRVGVPDHVRRTSSNALQLCQVPATTLVL